MPSESDPFCPIQELVLAITTGRGHESKVDQLILGRCRYSKSGNHMEFQLPSQTIGDCIWHRSMNAFCDTYSEGSMKGVLFNPLNIAGNFAFRRFGTNKFPLPVTLLHLLLQHSPCFKDGAKLVKVIYVDNNQLDEIQLAVDSCAYEGPCMAEHPWIEEPQLLQCYRLVDLLNTHITTYVALVCDGPMHDLWRIDRKLHPLWNDPEKSDEATVSAFHSSCPTFDET